MGEKKCNQLIEKREKRVTIGNASGLIEPDWLEILRGFLLFFFFYPFLLPNTKIRSSQSYGAKNERENMSGTK